MANNDLNQCQFIGRLGQDPKINFLPSGGQVANFSIACGWKSKDKDGVEWINIVAFHKLAEIVEKYLTKGQQVFVSGSLRTRKWQDKNGVERYTTEIVANQMQMLGGKGDGQRNEVSPTNGSTKPSANTSGLPYDDDIPF